VRAKLLAAADASINAFDTAALMTPELMSEALMACPGLDVWPLRTFVCLPDFLYPGEVSKPPKDSLVAGLKQQAERRQQRHQREDDGAQQQHTSGTEDQADLDGDQSEQGGIAAAYVYDEWSQDENDYYQHYCCVYEKEPPVRTAGDLPADVVALARRARRAFEMLRP
jgi:hypothetical protein